MLRRVLTSPNRQRRGTAARLSGAAALALALGACNADNPSEDVDATVVDAGDAGGDVLPDVGTPDATDASDAAPDVPPDVEEDTAPDVPDTTPDVRPDIPGLIVYASIDTVVEADTVQAGQAIGVSCILRTPEGDTAPPPIDFAPQVLSAPTNFLTREADSLIATRVGGVRVWCSAPAMGLTDPTSEEITILPGEVATTVAELDPHIAVAGDPITIRCEARDAYDNIVSDAELGVETDPRGEVTIDGNTISGTLAGLYVARCTHPDADTQFTDTFEVQPGPAAAITVAVEPNQPLYGLGDVVKLVSEVTDAYGNWIPNAGVVSTASPEVPAFGVGRFRLNTEGTITLTGTLDRGEELEPLTASLDVLVNEDGPAIECEDPFNGAILDRSPTGSLTLSGSVSDAIGVQTVLVNGEPASLDGASFSAEIPVRYGINFVDVEAVDTLGESNSRTCAFLVADEYAPANSFLDDGVTLRLAQNAIDDSNRSGGINSIGDALHIALNSPAIRDQIHDSFRSDPVLFDECIQDSFVGCILDAKVRYLDSRVSGPNTISLQLVNDGIRAVASVRNAAVRLDIDSNILDTSGWVTLRSLTLDLTIHLGMRGGVPTVTGSTIHRTDVGGIDLDFSGLSGDLLGALGDLFEDDIRDAIRDAIRDFLSDSLDDVIGGVFESLDVDSLADDFSVDRLDDSGEIELGFGLRFSTVTTNSSRALFGLGIRVTGPPGRPAGLGAPIPPGPVRSDPATDRTIAAGVNFGMLEQALFALWRAAFFDVTLSEDEVDSLPEGSEITLDVSLPPVVVGTDDNRVLLMLGGARADVLIPSLLAESLSVDLGAVLSATATIEGEDEITFGGVRIDELHLSTPNASLSTDTRDALEGFLMDTLQSIVDDALNSALPALPIPSFELPDDLAEFGLPAGLELGLFAPVLRITPSHFIAEGNFGAQ